MKTYTSVPKKYQTADGADMRIGLALGSGSARGWAHIGVIQELEEMGIKPGIVAGSSIGSFVGAAYASNHIDKLENWVRSLTWKEIINYIDLSVMAGGFIQGEKLFDFARQHVTEGNIENLPRLFGAVATELDTGREVWFREGPLLESVRASIALPGLFTPVKLKDRWLVDGGIANPVPVSLCRAMGANVVIAVNLNGNIVGKHGRNRSRLTDSEDKKTTNTEATLWDRISGQIKNNLTESKNAMLLQLLGDKLGSPSLFDVLASSINIMQDRITRSRMAGDPPEIILTPRLAQLGLLEFDGAAIAIREGRACVRQMQAAIEQLMQDL